MELDNFHDFAVAPPGTPLRAVKSSSCSAAAGSAWPRRLEPRRARCRVRVGLARPTPSSGNFIAQSRARLPFLRPSPRSSRSLSPKLGTGISALAAVAAGSHHHRRGAHWRGGAGACVRAVRAQSDDCLAVRRDHRRRRRRPDGRSRRSSRFRQSAAARSSWQRPRSSPCSRSMVVPVSGGQTRLRMT